MAKSMSKMTDITGNITTKIISKKKNKDGHIIITETIKDKNYTSVSTYEDSGLIFINKKPYKYINGKLSKKDKKIMKKEFKIKEQKYSKLKLKMMVIPMRISNYNLARVLPNKYWKKIIEETQEKNNNKCSICKTDTEKLVCHEVWDCDDTNLVMYLKECITICNTCHYCIHPTMASFTAKEGRLDINAVKNHFMQINNCNDTTYKEYKNYIQALEIYKSLAITEIGQKQWKINYGEYSDLVKKVCGDINFMIKKEAETTQQTLDDLYQVDGE